MTVRVAKALMLSLCAVALAGCSVLGTPTPSATPNEGTQTDVFVVKVGDCLNDGGVEGEVSSVEKIDCAQPHDSEAYASILMADGEFPGDDAVTQQALAGCETEFDSFVGVNYPASTLTFSYYHPTAGSWDEGDREILCLVADPHGMVTGTLAGAAR